MTDVPVDETLASKTASVIFDGFAQFRDRFHEITARADARFAERDWRGHQADAAKRLGLYAEAVGEVVSSVEGLLGTATSDRSVWAAARETYCEFIVSDQAFEIAESFLNSITRRIFHTEGVDPRIEFVASAYEPPTLTVVAPLLRSYGSGGSDVGESTQGLLEAIFGDCGFPVEWKNWHRDVRLAADEIDRHLSLLGGSPRIDRAEMLRPVFFRGRGAYVVGRFFAGEQQVPLALALHNTSRGMTIAAVLLEVEDISVLFSYTRSAFHVSVDRPSQLVHYLRTLMPHKKRAELYTTLGYHKHAKTELYRDFLNYISKSSDSFTHARGIAGMVMIVFTMPGYDVVFKVIRDRFLYPKQTTRKQVMSKYKLVFRHDRAGRLIDAQEFEHLRFAKDRFTPELLAELASGASRSVTVDGDDVTLHHVYVERRVEPLDMYVREANPIKATAAIIDYGHAIKNLAANNIFPGDMLLKNFGVTRSGRVVFYDYDELTLLTELNFRELPDTDDPDDAMSADPWFGVGEGDIFPEEFERFLGIRDELREAFDYHHGDLLGTRFWKRTQDRVRSGEVIEIFPYDRSRRLGAAARRPAEQAPADWTD